MTRSGVDGERRGACRDAPLSSGATPPRVRPGLAASLALGPIGRDPSAPGRAGRPRFPTRRAARRRERQQAPLVDHSAAEAGALGGVDAVRRRASHRPADSGCARWASLRSRIKGIVQVLDATHLRGAPADRAHRPAPGTRCRPARSRARAPAPDIWSADATMPVGAAGRPPRNSSSGLVCLESGSHLIRFERRLVVLRTPQVFGDVERPDGHLERLVGGVVPPLDTPPPLRELGANSHWPPRSGSIAGSDRGG